MLEICCSQTSYFQTGGHPHIAPWVRRTQPQTITRCYIDVTLDDLAFAVRIVPNDIGSHPGITGSFTVMEFAAFTPVIYLESVGSAVFLENLDQVATYKVILAALAETALSEADSKELIVALTTELYADREDHHDSEHLAKE